MLHAVVLGGAPVATNIEAITLVDLSPRYPPDLVGLLQHRRLATLSRELVRGGKTDWSGLDNDCGIRH